MPVIDIRTTFPEVQKALDKLSDNIGQKAIRRALNKTIDQGKTQMARQISKEFRIGVGAAKARLAVQKASTKQGAFKLSATLEATRKGRGRSMNLIAFVTKGRLGVAAAKRSGRADLAGQLQFKIKRGGGNKVIKGAFIGNAGRTVFIRTGKERLPIKSLGTIDIPQMFNTRRINDVVRKVMQDKFAINFDRELRSVLGGFAK